jgi:hypothetical protein
MMFSNQKIKVTDVIEVEGALRSLIRSKYPDIVVEPGSALNDLVIRSMGYIAAAVKSETDQVKERLYLNKLQNSTESNTQLLLEDLASNFLVSSDDVPPQKGVVSFVFNSSVDRIIPASIILTRGDTGITVKLFDSSEDITLTSSDYIAIGTGDEAEYNYSILMEVVGSGDTVSIVPGEFDSSVRFSSLVRIENKVSFLGITSTDFTRSSLVGKMQYAQTLRGFHSRNSIQATLLNEGIANLKLVVGIGAGDPEMARDVIPTTINSSRFHSLGMVNVVANSRLETLTSALDATTMQTPASPIVSIISLTREGSSLPRISDFGTARYSRTYEDDVTNITSSTIEEGAAIPAGSVSVSVPGQDNKLLNGNSTLGKYTLTVVGNEGGITSARFWVDNNIPVIQSLIDSDTYNTLGSDTKAMSAILVEVLIPKIKVKPVVGLAASAINVSSIKRVIINLINTWDNRYSLPVNEIVTGVSLLFGGTISNVFIPDEITYIVNLPDGRSLGYSTTDYITVEDTAKQLIPDSLSSEELLNLQVSDRVIQYYCEPQNITIEVLDV